MLGFTGDTSSICVASQSPHCHPQGGDSLRGREADHEIILIPATDDGPLIAVFPDPDHALGVHINFLALHVFKHYEFHLVLQQSCGLWLDITDGAADAIATNFTTLPLHPTLVLLLQLL
jgi:hypothetical protein